MKKNAIYYDKTQRANFRAKPAKQAYSLKKKRKKKGGLTTKIRMLCFV